jgi:hypothetical protein
MYDILIILSLCSHKCQHLKNVYYVFPELWYLVVIKALFFFCFRNLDSRTETVSFAFHISIKFSFNVIS